MPVWSHQFMPTNAKLTLFPNDEYVLSCDLDIIEFIQQALDLQGNPQELIQQVRELDIQQIEQALKNEKLSVLKQMTINIDGEKNKIEKFILPPASYIRRTLDQPPATTEYRIVGITRGKFPKGSDNIKIKFPSQWGSVMLTVVRSASMLVSPGGESLPISVSANTPAKATAFQKIQNYVYQGIIHIIPKGLDHILFVLALFLLSRNFKTLLWQITVFTAAHSITLFLASYQLVNVPAKIVEPLIALSIVAVALENLFHSQLKPWRIGIIFVFGLLHGLGFASVLSDLGLSAEWMLISLISFNIGVEIGHIVVVAAAFLLVGWFNQKDWYRTRIVLPTSGAIALIGLFWTVERIIA